MEEQNLRLRIAKRRQRRQRVTISKKGYMLLCLPKPIYTYRNWKVEHQR